jgi:hypothetical protein
MATRNRTVGSPRANSPKNGPITSAFAAAILPKTYRAPGKLPKDPSLAVNDEERELIFQFRRLTPTDRRRLLDVAAAWVRPRKETTAQAKA